MSFGYDFDDPLGQFRPRQEEQGPPQGAPAFRPPLQTPRQMASAEPNAEYMKQADQRAVDAGWLGDEGPFGDLVAGGRALGGLVSRATSGLGGWLDLPGGEGSAAAPRAIPARNRGPLKGPASPTLQTPSNHYSFPSIEQNRADVRKQGLESQGFTEAMPGQFIRQDGPRANSMRDMSGQLHSWNTPKGGGTYSGANSFTSPDIQAAEQISDIDRQAAVAGAKQRLATAQMQPQPAHPDIFQQRARAAAMLAQIPDPQFHKLLEALNAMVRGNFDQNAIGGLPLELQPPQ